MIATAPVPRPLWPVVTAVYATARSERPTVLVPDAEALHETVAVLRALMPERRVVGVPAWDVPLLDHTAPDPRGIAARAIAAEAVRDDAWDVLVVEAAARWLPLWLPAVPPRWTLATEAELMPAALVARGYRRVPEVSAPGEFAVRGELVDLWSPLEDFPVRVERFDVAVDQLKRMDPVSQLSTRPVEAYDVGVAAWPADEAAIAAAVAAVERRARRQQSDPVHAAHLIDQLQADGPCPGRTLWLHQGREAVPLPSDWAIVVAPRQVEAAHRQVATLWTTERQALAAEGVPTPHLDEPPLPTATHVAVDADGPEDLGIVAVPPAGLRDPRAELEALAQRAARRGWQVWLTAPARDRAAAARLATEAGLAVGEGEGPGVVRLLEQRIRGTWEVAALGLLIADLGAYVRPRLRPRTGSAARGLDLGDLKPGDLVVHEDYGIGRFLMLDRIELDGFPLDVVRLEYRGGDTVFVPVTRLGLLDPYRGGGETPPELDKLGSETWARRRAKAKEEMVRFAADLLQLYAHRERAERAPLPPPGELSLAVATTFPFEETPDQLRVLDEIEADLASATPMDRLLVGDVGYGKTEVALRAAVRFVEAGTQVAVLVPTTVLAVQHGRTFHERMKDLPVRIGVLSRFTPKGELDRLLKDVRAGRVDIVIGTHRLLQPDVGFDHLGLLVVDEEHRFGVKHKESLKTLRAEVDTLAMSATPIPRTLQLHMGGLRPMSIIATPPPNRLGVETRVLPYDPDTVREALLRERGRGGQAFVLHNRIEDLEAIAQDLQRLIGDLRIGIVHGKLRPQAVEQVFLDFMEHRIDVLVATTIIESGLDFPRANTLIVREAQNYGLAELYQLRGRIGRSDRRAFAYLTFPAGKQLPPKAEERLEVLRSFSNLGAGFHVAMRDLEIRGAGEVLGKKQAGQIKALGLSTLFRLLDEAVAEVQGTTHAAVPDPEIQGDMALVLSEDWIADPEERLRAYQRLARVHDAHEAQAAIAALEDRFGPAPDDDRPFLETVRLRPLLLLLHARALKFHGAHATVFLAATTPLDPVKTLDWAATRDDVQVKPDRLVLTIPPHGQGRAAAAGAVLRALAQIC